MGSLPRSISWSRLSSSPTSSFSSRRLALSRATRRRRRSRARPILFSITQTGGYQCHEASRETLSRTNVPHGDGGWIERGHALALDLGIHLGGGSSRLNRSG